MISDLIISNRLLISSSPDIFDFIHAYGRITRTKQITDPHFHEDKFPDYY